ncbi:EAL domain-containing protein [Neobacillus sp. D3-1R]|uniref:sensor domain-containing protein n=1 Tax=Neobacillus sp. D3-1R TaxID=3445778 RepID=UPI003FA113F7
MTLEKQEKLDGLLVGELAEKAVSFYHSLFYSNLFAAASFNKDLKMVQVNEAFTLALGYSPSNGHEWLEIQENLKKALQRKELRNGISIQQELTLNHVLGHSVFMRITLIPSVVEGELKGVILLGSDISHKVRVESIHKQLAFYDDMTGLPNRRNFFSTLGQYLREKSDSISTLYVVILSLDNLKELNSYGFHIGDLALKHIGSLLTKTYGNDVFIARINGNEFGIIVENPPFDIFISQIEGLLYTLNHIPQLFYGMETVLECSLGISQWPDHGHTAERLIHSAEKAMFTAKGTRSKYCLFTENMNPLYPLNLEHKIKKALQKNEFYLVFQPIVEIATKKVIGYEALVRWLDPEKGVIPPNQFIPFAEQSGIIIEIEKTVLMLACQKLKELDETHPGIHLSVNISGLHFHQNIVDHIQAAVQKAKVNPTQLKIEITETCSMKDPGNTIVKLHQLKKLGIKVSIDDFGSGYSSLQYLGNFPADEVKLDLSFINPITPQKTTIINAVLSIANDYKIEVVAEGIESEEQLQFLAKLGCKYGQGYLLGKPIKM